MKRVHFGALLLAGAFAGVVTLCVIVPDAIPLVGLFMLFGLVAD